MLRIYTDSTLVFMCMKDIRPYMCHAGDLHPFTTRITGAAQLPAVLISGGLGVSLQHEEPTNLMIKSLEFIGIHGNSLKFTEIH